MLESKQKQKEFVKGGIWNLNQQDLELIEGEKSQIDGIIHLCEFDTVIKNYLLLQVLEHFFGDFEQQFYDWFGSQGIIREC